MGDARLASALDYHRPIVIEAGVGQMTVRVDEHWREKTTPIPVRRAA